MLEQYSPNEVFVDIDRKRVGDLHCDPTAAKARVALFHFNGRAYELW
ncbi:MAG: hypothetical protein ACI8XZ_005195 [Gammaproteobacteria bacterium]|jgi:hypothetical protein